jgi:putative FmdB family regulatory protein
MPIYEYSCKKCGDTIEVIQKFSDPVLKKHKGCGGALTKLISASAFQLKGTGWYVTDYARKGKSGESDSGPSDSKTDSSKDKKADKPAGETSKASKETRESKKPAASGKSGD